MLWLFAESRVGIDAEMAVIWLSSHKNYTKSKI